MASRLPLAARTPRPAPPSSTRAYNGHGARHESELARRVAAVFQRIAPRLAGLSRMVAEQAFRDLFPGVPWANEGNDAGRGTALVDAYVADGSVRGGGHVVGFKSRTVKVGDDGKVSMPSKNFDVFGPSPNVGPAIAAVAALAAQGKPFPCVCFMRTPCVGASKDSIGDLSTMGVVAWAGVDLPTMLAAQRAKVARDGAPSVTIATGKNKGVYQWGTWMGLPERPPGMPKVGAGGYPGIEVYVTHPSDDGARGYRTLRVSLREQTFDLTSGEAGIARWLRDEGFPTRDRKR